MRSNFAVTAALVAGALAVPFVAKRDIVTEYDVQYVTELVTVTAGAETAESTVSVETSTASSSSQPQHWGHHWHPWSSQSQWSSATTWTSTEAASSTSAVSSTKKAPTTSTYVAPSSTYVPPSSSSSELSTSAAPSSSSQPTTSAAPPSSSKASSIPSYSSSTSEASSPNPTSYDEIVVYHHNIHRTNHSAPDVVFNQSLADTAMQIAQTCHYEHQMDFNNGGYGQNIAAGVDANNVSAVITDLFYNGEVGWYADLYGQDQPDQTHFEQYGHFTQIVWKNTVSVGCASYDCSSHGGLTPFQGQNIAPVFTVCNYYPPGNYQNEYADNVGKPLNNPTAQWNAGGYKVQSDSADQQ